MSSNILDEVLSSDSNNYEFISETNKIITYGVKGNLIRQRLKIK